MMPSSCRRGYCVQDIDILFPNHRNITSYRPYSRKNIQVCGFPLNDFIQLRWLMSTRLIRNRSNTDTWSLNDIQIELMKDNSSRCSMKDHFANPMLK